MARDTFRPQAERRWRELDGQLQTRLLNNVWCGRCRRSTTIVRYTGKIDGGDLVLEGRCITCDGRVARVIEGR